MTGIKKPEILQIGSGNQPFLVVSGAVHGNEHCGPKAIDRALGDIREGRIEITNGTAVFIRAANPLAYERGVRYVERNLNRHMYPKESPVLYEEHLDNVLCPVFRRADILLDLHSFTAPGEAFVFLGPPTRANAGFAKALGVRNFMHGWADSFTASGAADPRESQGTTEYARLHGALAATLECGSHNDPEAVEVGYQAILNTLAYFDIGEVDPALRRPRPVSQGEGRCVRLTDVFYKTGEGRFATPWQNMSEVRKGDLLATFNSGSRIVAPANGFIIMPFEKEKVGAEWFHFGVPSDYFARLG